MKKYVTTDAQGHTVNGQQLQPGKFIQNSATKEDLNSRIEECCCNSALQAALVSPFASTQSKLFMINCWNVAVDPSRAQSYTVVKEVTPVPVVTLAQKVDFAVAVVSKVYKNNEFREWAKKWLAGADRTSLSAKEVYELIQKETDAASDLEALTAWGETGGNDQQILHEIDNLEKRALHAVTAAELSVAATPDPVRAALEVSKAVSGLSRFGKNIDLASLADKVTAGDPPPTPVTR